MKTIIVCDDDIKSVEYLKSLIEEYVLDRKIQCDISFYRSGKELLEAENITIDIAVLDVEMDGLSGIQTGYEVLKRYPDATLMITTSFMRYLDDAMDLKVFRYFEKPVDRERFFRALDIALKEEKIIDVPTSEGIVSLYESEIVCIFSHLRKASILTDKGLRIKTKLNFKEWLKIIGENNTYASPHYSFIVNLKYVKECTKYSVKTVK